MILMTHADNLASLHADNLASLHASATNNYIGSIEKSRDDVVVALNLADQENDWLRAENGRLLNDNEALRAEVAALKEAQPAPEPAPDPAPEVFPIYAHSPANRTNFWQSIRDRTWADGVFNYHPGPWGHSELKWDAFWADAVAKSPEGLHTVVSPKVVDEVALRDFCEKLPQAWREKMIYAFYQEPEDNFTTEAQIEAFRANVRRAGAIVRPYGIRNGVELQEWSLNPNNSSYPSGTANLNRFVEESELDCISWSIYEKNLKDRIGDMVGRVTAFMAQYPSLQWDASACGIAVPASGASAAQRTTRANLTRKLIEACKANGATGFGWFDFPAWNGTLDYDVESDPELKAVLSSY